MHEMGTLQQTFNGAMRTIHARTRCLMRSYTLYSDRMSES